MSIIEPPGFHGLKEALAVEPSERFGIEELREGSGFEADAQRFVLVVEDLAPSDHVESESGGSLVQDDHLHPVRAEEPHQIADESQPSAKALSGREVLREEHADVDVAERSGGPLRL